MKVYCIISDERAVQLKSPSMFSRVLKRQGIKGTYVPFVVKPRHLGEAINAIRILHLAGASITVPYKEAVLPMMDVLSEGANIIGAVNTIVRDGDRLKGYNTNAIGIMEALEEAGFEVDGKIGAGFRHRRGGPGRGVHFKLAAGLHHLRHRPPDGKNQVADGSLRRRAAGTGVFIRPAAAGGPRGQCHRRFQPG